MSDNPEQKNSSRGALLAAGIGLGLVTWELVQRRREADLRGQVALITGGSRGLGLLLARELAREGCRIAICARDQGELECAREDLEGRGAEVLRVRCDVADRAQVDHLVQEVTRRFGRVDVLVNNAGIIEIGPVQTMTLEEYERAMGVMFWGVVYPTLALLPQMLERRQGRIVNVTSIGGKISVPHLLPYSCAKFAAVGFSEGLRAELLPEGISVTTVVPGLMRTGGHINASFKGQRDKEYAWFSLSASLPLISMDAEAVARRIVQATKRGTAELILSIPAHVGTRFHGLFPGATSDLLALVNQFLLPPANGTGTSPKRGQELQEQSHSRLLDRLTELGRQAARRFQWQEDGGMEKQQARG
jgi:NAD(P)-dependent dehydrogenase (short-subunit alcohol dehydrogenase family)